MRRPISVVTQLCNGNEKRPEKHRSDFQKLKVKLNTFGGPCRLAREAHYLVMGKTSASRDLLVGHMPCFAGHSHGMQGGAWLRAPLAKKGQGHPKMEAGLGRLPCSPRFSRIVHSIPEPRSLAGAAPRAAD